MPIGARVQNPIFDFFKLNFRSFFFSFKKKVIYRCWKITMRVDSDNRYPSEIKDTYEDFIYDDLLHRKF